MPKTTRYPHSSVANEELIVHEKEPANLESPPFLLQSFITPSEQFFVRSHFKRPDISVESWKLKIEGAVDRTLELGYSDLAGMPSRTQISMLECAGNGRAFLIPKEQGTQWKLGAVGNAEWTGVPLNAVLERAGLKSTAVDILFEGADFGEIEEEPRSPGEIHFARSIPLPRARIGDVLLASKMNGADLPPAHGFPLRAIVPGWYGMASVKWLSRIAVTDKPFDGFFQSFEYARWERPNGTPTLVPLTEFQVKTVILVPSQGEVVSRNVPYIIRGMAWAGESEIAQVEVSTDGGEGWTTAKLTGSAMRHTWRAWEHDWHPAPGRHTLMARGTDTEGRAQPMQRDKDRRSYEISHVIPIVIMVR